MKKQKKRNTKKVYCQNCKNKRKPQFCLEIGGLKIHLCKNCWIGFAYGLKQDFALFDEDEGNFRRMVEQTRKDEDK